MLCVSKGGERAKRKTLKQERDSMKEWCLLNFQFTVAATDSSRAERKRRTKTEVDTRTLVWLR